MLSVLTQIGSKHLSKLSMSAVGQLDFCTDMSAGTQQALCLHCSIH